MKFGPPPPGPRLGPARHCGSGSKRSYLARGIGEVCSARRGAVKVGRAARLEEATGCNVARTAPKVLQKVAIRDMAICSNLSESICKTSGGLAYVMLYATLARLHWVRKMILADDAPRFWCA